MVDDQRRALVDGPPIDQLLSGLGALQVGDGAQCQPEIEFSLITVPETGEGAGVALLAGITDTPYPIDQLLREPCHVSTVARSQPHSNSMQNKKLVQIVIWVVVVGMVLSMAVAAISLF